MYCNSATYSLAFPHMARGPFMADEYGVPLMNAILPRTYVCMTFVLALLHAILRFMGYTLLQQLTSWVSQ